MERDRIEATEDLVARAREVLPYESFDWIVRRPLHGADGFVFPLFAAHAQGCEIVDTAGRSFVDWANGWGCNLLGYRHPAVEAAIREQLAAGPLLSLTHPVEIEAAELLREIVPGAEMSAFCKTGTDAIAGAVRVARAATGRPIVLQHGLMNFRAWQETRAAADPRRADEAAIVPFPYGDEGVLAVLLDEHAGRVAAILMEPVRDELPPDGYLAAVRRLADRHGAVLIFDEVVTNFRVARGGAQELYTVTAGLICLGKAIGNGMPLAALSGRRSLMRLVTAVSFDSTFRGETLSLAAAVATLRVVRDEPVAEHLAWAGTELRSGFETRCAELGVAGALRGPPARMSVSFEASEAGSPNEQRELFLQECMKRGVLTNGHFLASYAHDEKALARTREAVDGALGALAEAQAARLAGRSAARSCRATGYLNAAPDPASDALSVWGWLLLEHAAADAIELVAPDGTRVRAERVARSELAQLHPHVANAADGGYAATLSAASFAPDGRWIFEIRAWSEERVAFRCRVRQRTASQLPDGPRSIADGTLRL
jgi:glutamate-1-semialdehyde 2,1-aminomutase